MNYHLLFVFLIKCSRFILSLSFVSKIISIINASVTRINLRAIEGGRTGSSASFKWVEWRVRHRVDQSQIRLAQSRDGTAYLPNSFLLSFFKSRICFQPLNIYVTTQFSLDSNEYSNFRGEIVSGWFEFIFCCCESLVCFGLNSVSQLLPAIFSHMGFVNFVLVDGVG